MKQDMNDIWFYIYACIIGIHKNEKQRKMLIEFLKEHD